MRFKRDCDRQGTSVETQLLQRKSDPSIGLGRDPPETRRNVRQFEGVILYYIARTLPYQQKRVLSMFTNIE